MASRLLWASKAAASHIRISIPHRDFASGNLKKKNIFFNSSFVKGLKYTDSHAWLKKEWNIATVGITNHAQDHLGDVVHIELPKVGRCVNQGGSFGAVKTVKAVSNIISSVTGLIIDVNEELNGSPGLINSSPYKKGWIMKVSMFTSREVMDLMTAHKYTKFCKEEDGH